MTESVLTMTAPHHDRGSGSCPRRLWPRGASGGPLIGNNGKVVGIFSGINHGSNATSTGVFVRADVIRETVAFHGLTKAKGILAEVKTREPKPSLARLETAPQYDPRGCEAS